MSKSKRMKMRRRRNDKMEAGEERHMKTDAYIFPYLLSRLPSSLYSFRDTNMEIKKDKKGTLSGRVTESLYQSM